MLIEQSEVEVDPSAVGGELRNQEKSCQRDFDDDRRQLALGAGLPTPQIAFSSFFEIRLWLQH